MLMLLSRSILALCAVQLAAFCLPAAAQGKDDLWDITMKMEMAGMPMSMPARTQRMCLEKGAGDDQFVPRQEDCKAVETKRAGNKLTFKMVCGGKNPMTATGEMTFSEGAYEGRMHMVGKMEGEQVDMTQTYSGKRIGNCTSTVKADIKAVEDQSKQNIAQLCKSGMDGLQWQLFVEPKAACAAQRAEFCGAVSAKARAMPDPSEYLAAVRRYPDLGNALSKCGENLAAITRTACARGMETRNWTFIGAGHCDDDVRTVGAANCKGRSFTAVPGGMGPVCSRYATIARGGQAPAETFDAASAPPAPASPPADPVTESVNTLRKLLPF
jgi:hypothetical protein